jgi:hypothetical protein
MLRLYDARTGQVSDIDPARPGRLVIQVAPTADLRGQVFADLVRRVAEGQRLRVFLFSDLCLDDLNVRPGLSGEPSGADLGVGHLSSRRALAVGRCATRLPTPGEVTARGLDPLALRLAVLSRHYREEIALTWDDVETSAATLTRLRDRMAEWARSPGRPMSKEHVARAESALLEDLDVAGAFEVIAELADDPSVEPGAKLETLIRLDLALGLDLVAHLGR